MLLLCAAKNITDAIDRALVGYDLLPYACQCMSARKQGKTCKIDDKIYKVDYTFPKCGGIL